MKLSNMFPIKNGLKKGDALSPLLFNIPLDYAIRKVQTNQEALKLNGTHQILVYDDAVNILPGSIHTINTEALVVTRMETGLGINAEKTKNMDRS
jgi:hypothetical protein